MLRNLIRLVACVGALLVPSSAVAAVHPVVRLPTTGHVTKRMAQALKRGSVLKTSFVYPSDGGGGAIPPPYPCQAALDGIVLVYNAEAWECFCPAPATGVCEWRLAPDYDGTYYPNWYVLRPPNGVSLCFF